MIQSSNLFLLDYICFQGYFTLYYFRFRLFLLIEHLVQIFKRCSYFVVWINHLMFCKYWKYSLEIHKIEVMLCCDTKFKFVKLRGIYFWIKIMTKIGKCITKKFVINIWFLIFWIRNLSKLLLLSKQY